MKRVWIGAAVGTLLGSIAFGCGFPHHSPEFMLLFVLTVMPFTTLGALIGGVQAILQELRALRRQRAMDIDDLDIDIRRGPSTGIRDL